MAVYGYCAKQYSGKIIEGSIEAQSEKDALEKLSKKGYIPVSLKEDAKNAGSPSFFSGRINTGIKYRQVTSFSRELASLLRSGVPILKAVGISSGQCESPALRNILSDIHSSLKRGASFSLVLSRYPVVFSPFYIAMIKAGENSGDLPEALLRICDYRMKQEELFSRFRMALVYPFLMTVVGLATVVFMLVFVMPRLTRIFADVGRELPLPTQILISASNALRGWWYWIFLILIVFALVAKKRLGTKSGKLSLSFLKLHIPVFGRFIFKAELSRFCRTLALLIKNGLPILKAISVAAPVVQNEIVKNQLKKSCKALERGNSFGMSLKDSGFFPMFMTNLILVGEESGRIESALTEIADAYEREVNEAIKIMDSLLEPLMVLGVGLVIGFIVIAMLLPVLDISI